MIKKIFIHNFDGSFIYEKHVNWKEKIHILDEWEYLSFIMKVNVDIHPHDIMKNYVCRN